MSFLITFAIEVLFVFFHGAVMNDSLRGMRATGANPGLCLCIVPSVDDFFLVHTPEYCVEADDAAVGEGFGRN